MSPTPRTKRRRTGDPAPFEKPGSSSTAQGKHALKWLLSGISPADFFKTYFEKKPTLRHNAPSKFKPLVTTAEIRRLLSSGRLCHSTDVDITHYTPDTGRVIMNGKQGTAAQDAWAKLEKEGCSLRLLRPQQCCDNLWRLCAHLEAFLGCVVGVNAYVTPSGHQGFAPHFDDVDAFVCQIEGEKHWRVYGKRTDGLDDLPRGSSVDFGKDDMEGVPVAYDVILKPGDMLYLPRGRIHEAKGCGGVSLHVTVSMYQKWTWADFLLESFKVAVESAAMQDRSLRRGLPIRFGEFVGVGCGERDQQMREWFQGKVKEMVGKVGESWPTDTGGDMMMSRFMRERLPPPAVRNEQVRKDAEKVEEDSVLTAVGGGVARVVMGTDGLPRLIHCLNNSRGAGDQGKDDEGLSCLPEEALAVDTVLKAYPDGMQVGDLPLEKEEDKIELAKGLVEMGIAQLS